jgi:hypothetical protein
MRNVGPPSKRIKRSFKKSNFIFIILYLPYEVRYFSYQYSRRQNKVSIILHMELQHVLLQCIRCFLLRLCTNKLHPRLGLGSKLSAHNPFLHFIKLFILINLIKEKHTKGINFNF